jgi:hypothetical protein
VQFTERVIQVGMRLHVRGWNQREPDAGSIDADRAGYRDAPPTIPVFSRSRLRSLLLVGDRAPAVTRGVMLDAP